MLHTNINLDKTRTTMSNRSTATSTISSAGTQSTINTQQQQQSVMQEYLDDLLWNFITKTHLDKLPLAVIAIKQ